MGSATSQPQQSQAAQGAQTAPAGQAEAAASSCPVVGQGYKNPAVYNVYNQRINDPSCPLPQSPLNSLKNADVLDPRNNMPLEPNQLPCPGQRKLLSTERAVSGIPKGGTESTWLFPSPQMVFNGACLRSYQRAQHNTSGSLVPWQRTARCARTHGERSSA